MRRTSVSQTESPTYAPASASILFPGFQFAAERRDFPSAIRAFALTHSRRKVGALPTARPAGYDSHYHTNPLVAGEDLGRSARRWELGDGSVELGAGSEERGSRERTAGSEQQGANSRELDHRLLPSSF